MNREEARMELIRTKRVIYMYDLPSEAFEALDMAIEALQTDVVRCKDCRYRKKIGTSYYCELDEFNVKDADFCSWGERREK